MWDEIQMDCLSTEFESTVLRRIYAPDGAKSHRPAPRDSGDLPRP